MSHNPPTKHQTFADSRLELAGDILSFSKYGKTFSVGKRPYRKSSKPRNKGGHSTFRGVTVNRAKKKVIATVNTNARQWPDENGKIEPLVFVTLTYDDKLNGGKIMADVGQGNKDVRAFLLRLSNRITKDNKQRHYLKYTWVTEFQRRSAVHYHLAFYNLPFIWWQDLEKLWGHGFIWITAEEDVDIKKHQSLGHYLAKYMAKDLADPRLWDFQNYGMSRGLKQPLKLYNTELADTLTQNLPLEALIKTEKDAPTSYLGLCDRLTFDLKNYPELKAIIQNTINAHPKP
jgi:hypothetical protein